MCQLSKSHRDYMLSSKWSHTLNKKDKNYFDKINTTFQMPYKDRDFKYFM